MYTVCFIGPSGTGKSHRAVTVAREAGVQAIIDDGLLISKNKVLAGFSAKKESTKIAAVRRALFIKREDAENIKNAFKAYNIESVMILGTSLKMALRIAEALEIEPIDKIIKIEEIATKEEMAEAKRMRFKEGKHVIPVPAPEIKQDFSGYFLHALRQIRRSMGKAQQTTEEKSIVRPTFSYLGEYTISDSVIKNIAAYEIQKLKEVSAVNFVYVRKNEVGADIFVGVTLRYGAVIPKVAADIRRTVVHSIYHHTSINVKNTDVTVKRIVLQQFNNQN